LLGPLAVPLALKTVRPPNDGKRPKKGNSHGPRLPAGCNGTMQRKKKL
jgi:hypothetical protein